MDYDAVLAQVLELLQRELRLSYRVLKLRFQLDDETLEALKEDLVYAKQLAVDEAGGRVSKVEMTTPIALICKMLFPSISTFETPPSHDPPRAVFLGDLAGAAGLLGPPRGCEGPLAPIVGCGSQEFVSTHPKRLYQPRQVIRAHVEALVLLDATNR